MHAMKAHRMEEEVWFHSFLTSAPYGDEWSASHPRHFTSRGTAHSLNKRPGGPSEVWTFSKQQTKFLPLAGLKP
jgi:hypothetical protein